MIFYIIDFIVIKIENFRKNREFCINWQDMIYYIHYQKKEHIDFFLENVKFIYFQNYMNLWNLIIFGLTL